MSFLGCSVCSSDYVRDANGDPLYCPVCSSPTREQLERDCVAGADAVDCDRGVTALLVMFKRCQDGSVDLSWAVRGFERNSTQALDIVIEGLRRIRERTPDDA